MTLGRHTLYTKIFASLPLPLHGKILGVSGLKYFIGSRNYTPPLKVIADDAEITNTEYPKVNICSLPYPDNTFDYVIADMVIEHVEGNPQHVFDELKRVLKPGGTAIVTSAFIHPVHFGPKDFWRFSPDAFRYLARDWGSIVTVDGWGNRWVHALIFLHRRTIDWVVPKRRFSLVRWLAEYNDPTYPFTTWIIAKK